MFHFAYVFERFPSFTQTFCVREVLELERLGVRPMVFSIRETRDEVPRHFPEELYRRVHFLPAEKELIEFIKEEKDANRLPQQVVLSLRHWGDRPDKMRVYEAAYIGQKMRADGLRHAHSHFAGLGARVGWWLRWCYDFTFSFTGHANDILVVEEGLDLTLGRLMDAASLIVTVSDFTAGDLCRRFPAAARKVRRVYNGLDVERFATVRKEAPPPLILSVGRLIEKKGYPDLIEACALLSQRGHAFRCEIAGDGPMEAELRSLIAARGLDGVVTLLGATPMDVIVRKLAGTCVFALGCVVEADGGMDNLPTVLIEAMAAGVPCVSTRLAGVPEIVDHGVTGLLVEPGDSPALAGAIETLLSDPALATRMGAAGLERARRVFSQSVTAAQLLGLLASRGLMAIDPSLATRHPTLWAAYARQMAWRTARLARLKRFGHRRAPAFLDPPA